jgi:ankyrin repeat protein
VVQLIHQTAREFLLDKEGFSEPYNLDEAQGDREIAITCSRYISLTFMAAIAQMEVELEPSQIGLLAKYLSDHHLLEYALRNLNAHLEHLGNNAADIRTEFGQFVRQLRKRRQSYASLILSQWIETSTRPTKLHMDVDERSARLCLRQLLAVAANTKNHKVLQVLFALRADLLHLAAEHGSDEIMELLLEINAEIEVRDLRGRTPLHLAAEHGNCKVVELLLKHGANLNVRDLDKQVPLHLAVRSGNYKTVTRLVSCSQIDATDLRGRTPLHLAAEHGCFKIVWLLLENAASLEARNLRKQVPLHLAAKRGHYRTVRQLVSRGAQIKAKDMIGREPWHLAAEQGHFKIVELLLPKGAKRTAEDLGGRMSQQLAVDHGHEEIELLLQNQGAWVDAKNLGELSL